MPNQRPLDLAEQLHKPITKKFEKREVYTPFTWGHDLGDMQLKSKFNKGC